MNLELVEQAEVEWEAWQAVCELLAARGVVVNDDHRLMRAIEAWGEELVTLRVEQSPEVRAVVLKEKRQAFADLGVTFDG